MPEEREMKEAFEPQIKPTTDIQGGVRTDKSSSEPAKDVENDTHTEAPSSKSTEDAPG